MRKKLEAFAQLKNKKFIFKMLMSDIFKYRLTGTKVYYGVLIKNILSRSKEEFKVLCIDDRCDETLKQIKKLFVENSGELYINSVEFGGTYSVLKNKSKNNPILIFNPILDSAKQDNVEFMFLDMRYSFNAVGISSLLEEFNLSQIIVNHLIWTRDLSIVDELISLNKGKGIKIVVAVHDFFYICPSFNLLNYEGKYCNLPNLEACNSCLNKISHLHEPPELLQYTVTANLYKASESLSTQSWRLRFSRLFDIATQIILPSQSTRELFLRAYSGYYEKSIVVKHDLQYLSQIRDVPTPDVSKQMCVAVMGEITYNKGLNILEELVTRSREDDLKISFLIIGRCHSKIILDSLNTLVLDEYVLTDLNSILLKHNVSLFLFLSIWPETFSFVAHEMMQTKLPILSFNLGAQGEFIGNYDNGVLVDDISASAMYDALMYKYKDYECTNLSTVTKSVGHCGISVAIATYNGEKYIKEQLDSILAQTHSVDEIIIVDDCSSDETWNILAQYATNNSKIKIFRNETNLGGTKTFEKAIYKCNGDYIALADQDDVWLAEKIAVLLNQIGDNWLIYSDAFVVDTNLNVTHPSYTALKPNLGGNFVKYLIMNDVTGCTVMFSRQLVEKCFPIPDGYYVHDHYLALMASFFNKINYCDKPLIYYRQHSENQIGASKLRNYANWQARSLDYVNSCNALLSTTVFKDNFNVKQALKYYEARLSGRRADLSVYLWSYKYFGLVKTVEYIAMTLFGSAGAKLIFKLTRS